MPTGKQRLAAVCDEPELQWCGWSACAFKLQPGLSASEPFTSQLEVVVSTTKAIQMVEYDYTASAVPVGVADRLSYLLYSESR